jgi:hypothetical protein
MCSLNREFEKKRDVRVISPLGRGFKSHPARWGHTPDGFGDTGWLFAFSENLETVIIADVFKA